VNQYKDQFGKFLKRNRDTDFLNQIESVEGIVITQLF